MFYIDILKAIATSAITNSHLRGFYPIERLATGGMLGNMIFFFCSGCVLTDSLLKRPKHYWPWISRRLLRLYAPYWIMLAIVATAAHQRLSIGALIYPDDYWFIPILAIIYIPAYYAIVYGTLRDILIVIISLFLLFLGMFIAYVDDTHMDIENHVGVKSVFYMMTFVTGIVHVKFADKINLLRTLPLAAWLALVTLLAILMIVFELYIFQFVIELLALEIVLILTLFATKFERNLFELRRFRFLIEFFSSITLEIYIVQVQLLQFEPIRTLRFPLNVASFLLLTVAGAFVLHKIADAVFTLAAAAPARTVQKLDRFDVSKNT